jgi:hypothetical protein
MIPYGTARIYHGVGIELALDLCVGGGFARDVPGVSFEYDSYAYLSQGGASWFGVVNPYINTTWYDPTLLLNKLK